MEYGDFIDFVEGNTNYVKRNSDLYTKYVGYDDTNLCIEQFYNPHTIDTISRKVTQLLKGVHPENRPIIVPDNIIKNVMDSISNNYRPSTGDIYGRYNVPTGTTTVSYVQDMIDQVIELIVADVRTNYETEENNSKLSIWTTVLGSFNDNQLRSHPVIKIKKRHPNYMEFNMKY
jgi:hypothetical protein